MRMQGRVLWWSERDCNGIIIDSIGNELYFDKSVLSIDESKIKSNMKVIFTLNDKIQDCLCAKNIRGIKNKTKKGRVM